MENNQVLCDSPRVILNPLAGEFISRFGSYVLDGVEYKINKRLAYFDSTVKRLKPRLVYSDSDPGFGASQLSRKRVCSVDDHVIDNSYFFDPHTGECFPMYFKVRCGHCPNCKKSKVYSLVQRCKMESCGSKYNPIFLTLTYNDENKPKEGVCLRDVQLFFKRLRINLQRHGYTDSIRYFLTSEYGFKTSRPHYHALIWNLHQSDMVSYKEIGDILKKSWNNGFIYFRQVDMRDDKAFFYTSKYIGKDSNVPDGQNPTFMVSSNRGGAIGALFLASLAPEIRHSLNVDPKFLNPFSGKVESLTIDRFVMDRLFPSVSRSLTSKVRSSVKRYVCNVAALRTYENDMPFLRNLSQFDEFGVKVLDFFTKYMFIYNLSTVSLSYLKPYNQVLRELDEDYVILSRFMRDCHFEFDLVDLDRRRNLYISKLLCRNIPKVDLAERSREWTRLVNYLSQFEVF